jgi:hypothetical protein
MSFQLFDGWLHLDFEEPDADDWTEPSYVRLRIVEGRAH